MHYSIQQLHEHILHIKLYLITSLYKVPINQYLKRLFKLKVIPIEKNDSFIMLATFDPHI